MTSKEKQILTSEKIMRKIEPHGVFLEAKRTTISFMAGLAISVNIANGIAVVNPNTRDQRAEFLNSFKPVGPYSVSEPSAEQDSEPVQIPAYGSDALRLRDDMDGLLQTSGYAVFVDYHRLINGLAPNEIAVVTQEVITSNGVSKVSGTTYAPFGSSYSDRAHETLIEGGVDVPPYDFASNFTAGDALSLQEDGLADNYIQINGGGAWLHSVEPSRVTVDTYQVDDGVVTPVTHMATEVEIVDNVQCDDVTERLTSEVIMAADEHDVICRALKDYAGLLPDDFRIRLDSVDGAWKAHDSADMTARAIQLTYPYIGREIVEEDDMRQTLLHEIIHTIYATQTFIDGSYADTTDHVYQGLRNNSEFRIPSPEEAANGITPSVGEVEEVWGAITESTYTKNDSTKGHPWDSASEMIASTAGVTSRNPDGFIEKYKALGGSQQEAVRQAVRTTFELIERYDVSIASIIPAHDLIVDELGL